MSNGYKDYKDAEDFKNQNGYEIDGIWYPRVTRIVSIKAKPGLAHFYREVGGRENGQIIANRSAEEGSAVHEAVEAILMGKEPEVPENISAAVHAFRDFLEKTPIESSEELIEQRVFHPEHRYAGTVDALATIDGKFGVLDIKTSLAIYRDYDLQTSAYMDALASRYENLETRWILRIDQVQICERCGATRRTKGGREKIREIYASFIPPCDEHAWGEMVGRVELRLPSPSWRNDFEAFLAAKRLWEWENEEWLKKVGYLSH